MSQLHFDTPDKAPVQTIQGIDISNKPSPHSLWNKFIRIAWSLVYHLLFRPSPRPMLGWRRFLLGCFGARISRKARVYPKARIWAPWHLHMGDYATLSDYVDCYCVAPISIGSHATVSQYSYLCSATHDHEDANFTVYSRPIIIGAQAWIAADVFVGPGVTIGEGTVVGARSSVYKDLPPWKVCVGNPAKPLKDRVIKRDRRGKED
jgi:putative colanic acid biosynthesis acetyltransferase WcaF